MWGRCVLCVVGVGVVCDGDGGVVGVEFGGVRGSVRGVVEVV